MPCQLVTRKDPHDDQDDDRPCQYFYLRLSESCPFHRGSIQGFIEGGVIKNYTTSVSAERTIGEIMGILASKGAREIMLEYDDEGQVNGLS